jgi:biopolymer transport protein ExbD
MHDARRNARVPERDLALQVVPLIDIMFLLLLFFMLGADMSQREASALVLPRADVPEEQDPPGLRRLVANIRHAAAGCALHEQGGECREPGHWQRTLLGVDYSRAEVERLLAGAAADAGPQAQSLHLLVRADMHAPYGEVQQLFEGAARAGVYRIELAAARR